MVILKPLVTLLFTASAAVMLASCASTPQSRIERNPALYQSLSSAQQDAVRLGKILPGMPHEGVHLAWGRPAQVSSINKGGQLTERWMYTALEPVYTTSIGMGFGHYSGYHHGPGYYGCYEPHFIPTVDYVPVPAARVDFRNGKVVEFEVRRQY